MSFELTEQITRHLSQDIVAWLTTVSPTGRPIPRPIWFVWDGSTIDIYSLNTAARLKNIKSHQLVSVHFNSTVEGEDVVTLSGPTQIIESATPPSKNEAYMAKYGLRMEQGGMKLDMVDRDYGVMIRVTPDNSWTV